MHACVHVEIILTEGILELADFCAWGKAYKCEICNGTSHWVLCVQGTCKVQSTQQFVIEFYFMSGCVSCHVTSHHVVSCWAYPSTTLSSATLLRGPEHVRHVQNC